jgi:hypothetical protein
LIAIPERIVDPAQIRHDSLNSISLMRPNSRSHP